MKLQNNKKGYTTTEQAKVLLKLGLQADSADCYYNPDGENIGVLPDNTTFSEFNKSIKRVLGKDLYPCWSVGRLIEIICNCHVITNQLMENWICCDKNTNLIKLLIRDIEAYKNAQHIDFSKLED